jgi:hypothetical protein
MDVQIVSLLIGLVAQVIIMVPVLWIVGLMLTSAQNAKFTDAIMIVVLGSIASTIVGIFLPGIVGSLVRARRSAENSLRHQLRWSRSLLRIQFLGAGNFS